MTNIYIYTICRPFGKTNTEREDFFYFEKTIKILTKRQMFGKLLPSQKFIRKNDKHRTDYA